MDHGFGTFIVHNGATRQLSHQAVHPIADSTTEIQAVTVLKGTDSRSYVMAGAHRDANPAPSTNEELLAYCPNTDVYPSHGRDVTPEPTDKVAVLRRNVLVHHPTWDVDLPGSRSYILNATENVQGRLLNGVLTRRRVGQRLA